MGRGHGRKALNVTDHAAEGVRSIGFLILAIVFVNDDYS